jgi:hypothetical protein
MFPEQLSYENKLSYIAGYTDGDGSLYLTKNNAITLSFVSGSKEILNGIKNFFDINYYSFEYKNKGLAKLYNYETHFRYKLNGKRVEKIVHDIKLLNLPLLERKWGGLLL